MLAKVVKPSSEAEIVSKLTECRRRKKEVEDEQEMIRLKKVELATRMWEGSPIAKDLKGNELNKEYLKNCINHVVDKIIDAKLEDPVIIGLMDGALPFMGKVISKLADRADINIEYGTMRTESYSGTERHDPKVTCLPKPGTIAGRNVIILDDVLDTGASMKAAIEALYKLGAKSITVVVLVDKKIPDRGIEEYIAGCEVNAEDFLIGCGLDYKGLFRITIEIRYVIEAARPTKEEDLLLSKRTVLSLELEKLIADETKYVQKLEKIKKESAAISISSIKQGPTFFSPEAEAATPTKPSTPPQTVQSFISIPGQGS